MKPWSIKYQPKSSSQVQGQNKALSELLNYLNNLVKGKSALIYGPPGCGKTSAVHAIASEFGYELVEVNASDVRDRNSIKERLGASVNQMSLFGNKKLILVDEIDGISGSADRGGLSELSKIIDKSSFPIIMTANDPYDKKFSTLRKKSNMIQFRTLAYPSVLTVLKNIASKESIDYDEVALTALARRAGGDLRGAVSDFQTLAQYSGKLTAEDVDELSGRRQTNSMVNALIRIFKTTNPEIALPALDDVNEDIDKIFLWIDENLPKEYKKAEDLATAFDNLSLADVYRGRIKRWQYWRFLVYIYDLLTAGIALSKKEKYPGFNKYTRTTRIIKRWQFNQKNAKRKAIAEKIAEKTHTSARRVIQDTLPYVRQLIQTDKSIADYFEFSKEEIEYLKT